MDISVLAMDRDFLKVHAEPLSFSYSPVSGTMITVKTHQGPDANVFEVKGSNPLHTILMFHEWWGLNDYIKREAEKLSDETGATVLALDLFDGKVTGNRDSAARFSGELKPERAMAIIEGTLAYLGKDAVIQTIGWCMGGSYSLQAAIAAGKQAKGCVMYYGMPETDTERLKQIQAPVLAIFAKKDKWITPAVANTFRETMVSAGKQIELKFYEADHAFANPSNPDHDKVATADARKHALAFLRQNFAAMPLKGK